MHKLITFAQGYDCASLSNVRCDRVKKTRRSYSCFASKGPVFEFRGHRGGVLAFSPHYRYDKCVSSLLHHYPRRSSKHGFPG